MMKGEDILGTRTESLGGNKNLEQAQALILAVVESEKVSENTALGVYSKMIERELSTQVNALKGYASVVERHIEEHQFDSLSVEK